LRCASVDDDAGLIDRRFGSIEDSLMVPFTSDSRMVADFFEGDGGADLVVRHQRAV